jgi:hypothetical protein
VKSDEKPPCPRRQPSTVGQDEVLRDSRGCVIDDAYVEGAVEDALSEVTERRDG